MNPGSTGAITTILKRENNDPIVLTATSIRIQLSQKNSLALRAINYKYKLPLSLPSDERLNIYAIQDEFAKLCEIENTMTASDDKLVIKKYKLDLIKAFENHLLNLAHILPEDDKNEIDTPCMYYSRRIAYGILLSICLVMDGIGSFLGGQELIMLIPNVSNPMVIGIGFVFSLINSALYYSFDAAMLKQSMGLDSIDDASLHLTLDEEEIERINHINHLMRHQIASFIDKNHYSSFSKLTSIFNQNIIDKNQVLHKNISESAFYKTLRHIVTGLGAIMTAGFNYFMANALLTYAAPALVGTPIGWALISLGVGAMVIAYLATRSETMVNMLNPAIQKFKEVKNIFNQFEPLSEQDFKNAYEDCHEKSKVTQLHNQMKVLKKENQALRTRLMVNSLKQRVVHHSSIKYTSLHSQFGSSLSRKLSIKLSSEFSQRKKDFSYSPRS